MWERHGGEITVFLIRTPHVEPQSVSFNATSLDERFMIKQWLPVVSCTLLLLHSVVSFLLFILQYYLLISLSSASSSHWNTSPFNMWCFSWGFESWCLLECDGIVVMIFFSSGEEVDVYGKYVKGLDVCSFSENVERNDPVELGDEA